MTLGFVLGFTEEPVTFTIPLKDVRGKEFEEVSMECSINKPNKKLKWTKDGCPLGIDARCVVTSRFRNLVFFMCTT